MSLNESIAASAAAGGVPKEWQPYAEEYGNLGKAAVLLPKPGCEENDLLISGGFDPALWRIKGAIRTRRWQQKVGEPWLYYYAFEVEQGERPEDVAAHVEDLTKLIRRRKRRPASGTPVAGDDAFVYVASDWQVGKREGSDGTPETVDRVLQSVDLAIERIKELRRIGRKMPTGVFLGGGDIGEGTCGFYPGMSFLIDRNRRDQNKINRELITHALDEFLPYFDRIIVGAVPGNHGENREDGQRVTDVADNDDLAIFECVREAFDKAGEDRIEWRIPESEPAMLLNLGGVDVGLTHGHHFKGGLAPLSAQKGALEWWKGQDFGGGNIRGAQVLISCHFHHFSVNTFGHRTHIQTPAMDPGSAWVRYRTGDKAPAGVVTVRFDASQPLGFADLSVLSPSGQ